MVSFRRPVGAAADLREIEYVSALHQSGEDGGDDADSAERNGGGDSAHGEEKEDGRGRGRGRGRGGGRGGCGGGGGGCRAGGGGGGARTDGSIVDADVRRFILSRYGVVVTDEDVRGRIFPGLAGSGGNGRHEEDAMKVDLAELTAVLLIPTLLRAAAAKRRADGGRRARRGGRGRGSGNDAAAGDGPRSHREEAIAERSALFDDVLTMILRDVTGSLSGSDGDNNEQRGGGRERPPPGRPLTVGLVRDILLAYGEDGLAADDGLMREMVAAAAAARGGGGEGGGEGGSKGRNDDEPLLLDANSFARALTSDVRLYNYDGVLSGEVMGLLPPSSSSSSDRRFDSAAGHREEDSGGGGGGDSFWADDAAGVRSQLAAESGPRAKDVESPPPSPSSDVVGRSGTKAGGAAGAGAGLWPPAEIEEAKRSMPGIDFAADRYRSKWIATLLWIGFVLSYFSFLRETVQTIVGPGLTCMRSSDPPGFGCEIANAIVAWLVILMLLIFWGTCYVGLGSIGNGMGSRRPWTILIGMAEIVAFNSIFFIVYAGMDYDNRTSYELFIASLTCIVAFVTLVLQALVLVDKCRSGGGGGKGDRFWWRSLFVPGNVKLGAQTRTAAARKVDGVVRNAMSVHRLDDGTMGVGTSFGNGLLNFVVAGGDMSYEEVGGFLWVWRRIYTGELFEGEGIWISPRVLAGNLGQFILSIFILVAGGYFVAFLVERWQKGLVENDAYVDTFFNFIGAKIRDSELVQEIVAGFGSKVNEFLSLNSDDLSCSSYIDGINEYYGDENLDASQFCELMRFATENALHNVTAMLKESTSVATNAIDATIASVVNTVYPQEQYMVEVPAIVMVVVAFVSCLALSIVYIPSVASTTLQFRAGIIPFFDDSSNFKIHRRRMSQVTILLASMFWGALYSSVLLGFLVAVIIFILLWQVSQPYLVGIFALLIGLTSTLLLKLAFEVLLLKGVYSGFYRENLARANLGSMWLECANVAFAVGTALARAFQLIFVAIVYVGRIDTPLLAPGVFGGDVMDMYPTIFRKDILVHEAHRHPYMELLGSMYMTKLRYGESFGSRAGYCYRLIFTIALMPWLRKYRIMARPRLMTGGGAENRGDDGGLGREGGGWHNATMPKSLRRSSAMASVVGSLRLGNSLLLADGHGTAELLEQTAEMQEGARRDLRSENDVLRSQVDEKEKLIATLTKDLENSKKRIGRLSGELDRRKNAAHPHRNERGQSAMSSARGRKRSEEHVGRSPPSQRSAGRGAK